MSGSIGPIGGERPVLPPGRYVELPGRGRTFIRELPGPDGAPVVVLLHGWSATADLNWFPCFAPLAEHFRVIALDHRGHGRGLKTKGPFRLDHCADDVAALAAELGIDRCIPVGYSMGGPIAQLLWRRHPELVQGLVLCATSANFNGSVRERLLFGVASGTSLVAGTMPLRPVARTALGAWNGWRRVRGGPWWGFDEVARHDWPKVVQAGREIGRFDSRRWVGDVSAPTAVIATDDDDVVPAHRQRALADAIPGSTLRTVPGGHAACTMMPEVFVPALLDACTEVAGRSAAPVAPGAVAVRTSRVAVAA